MRPRGNACKLYPARRGVPGDRGGGKRVIGRTAKEPLRKDVDANQTLFRVDQKGESRSRGGKTYKSKHFTMKKKKYTKHRNWGKGFIRGPWWKTLEEKTGGKERSKKLWFSQPHQKKKHLRTGHPDLSRGPRGKGDMVKKKEGDWSCDPRRNPGGIGVGGPNEKDRCRGLSRGWGGKTKRVTLTTRLKRAASWKRAEKKQGEGEKRGRKNTGSGQGCFKRKNSQKPARAPARRAEGQITNA